MLDGAARNCLKLGAGYMRRYYWAVEEARRMLRTKVLGPLMEVVASESAQLEHTGLDMFSYRNSAKASGGGVLVETGCHLLDQVMFVSDARGADIQACTQRIWKDCEVETIASGHIALESGERVALQFAVSGIRPVFAGIAFRCELGEIRLRVDPAKGLEVFLGHAQPHRLEVPHPQPGQQHRALVLAAFRSEWRHFLEAVQTNGEWDLHRETGLITSDVIMQCGELAKVSCAGVQK
jgi:predicted dehydrogenase